MKTILRFLKDERGTETVEWAVVLGIIAIGAITTAVALGGHVLNAFTTVESQFP